MVIWITGLSGAGKTTLCEALFGLLKPRLPELLVLDGDVIRAACGNDLTHAEADRMRQIKRIQALAKTLADQGLVVVVGALYAHPDLLRWNRENMPDYFEVYLQASLETVRKRDAKGLYAKAEAGEMANVVGIDIPWHAPESPDMEIDMNHPDRPDALAWRVARAVPRLAGLLPVAEEKALA